MINITHKIYLEECEYEKKKAKKKTRYIKETIVIPSSHDSDESDDEFIE